MNIETTRVDELWRAIEGSNYGSWRRIYAPNRDWRDLFKDIVSVGCSPNNKGIVPDGYVYINSRNVEEASMLSEPDKKAGGKCVVSYQKYAKLSEFGISVRGMTTGSDTGSIEIIRWKDGREFALFKYNRYVGSCYTCFSVSEAIIEVECKSCENLYLPSMLNIVGLCNHRCAKEET